MERLLIFQPSPGTNPYIDLLRTHLEKDQVLLGVLPKQLTRDWFASRSEPPGSILHFHWPSYGYTGATRDETLVLVEEWGRCLHHAKDLGFRIVWTVHNLYPHDSADPDLQHAARLHLLLHADGVIVHSPLGVRLLEDTFGSIAAPVAVIPHGHFIDCQGTRYGTRLEPEEARQKLGLSASKRVYLCFGLMRLYKGIETLISAFVNSGAAGDLVIAGAPADTSLVRRILQMSRGRTNVHVRAFFIPDRDVNLYFSAADVVVLPYRQVFTSGVIMLAHSFAVPVIAPAVGCLPDMLPEGTGILFEAGNESALAAALHDDAGLHSNAIRQNCLDFARRHDWDTIAGQLKRFYQSLPRSRE